MIKCTHLRSTIGGFNASIWEANSAADGTDIGGSDTGEDEEEEAGGFLWLLDIRLLGAPGTIGMSITEIYMIFKDL